MLLILMFFHDFSFSAKYLPQLERHGPWDLPRLGIPFAHTVVACGSQCH